MGHLEWAKIGLGPLKIAKMATHNKGVSRLKNGTFVPTAPNGPKTAILAFLAVQQEPFVPNAIV
jgi:hypothetical protein